MPGGRISPQMQSLADDLVQENTVDTWMIVNYSRSYKLSPLEAFD